MKKQKCIDCEKETTNGVFILTGEDWKYEYYCIMCARAYLGKFAPMSLAKATRQQLNELSQQYDMLLFESAKGMKKDGYKHEDIPKEYKKYLLKKYEEKIK